MLSNKPAHTNKIMEELFSLNGKYIFAKNRYIGDFGRRRSAGEWNSIAEEGSLLIGGTDLRMKDKYPVFCILKIPLESNLFWDKVNIFEVARKIYLKLQGKYICSWKANREIKWESRIGWSWEEIEQSKHINPTKSIGERSSKSN